MAEELSPEQYERLNRLLSTAFDVQEMLDLLCHLPGGIALADNVAAESRRIQFFMEVCRALNRHGMLDARFFGRLAAVRSGRFGEIQGVAALFGVALDEAPVVDEAEWPRVSVRVDASIPHVGRSSELRPTLAEWLEEQRGAVAILVAAPIAAAVIVGSLGGAKAALFAGQALFASVVARRVWRWTQPGGDARFGPSVTVERMCARLEAAGPRPVSGLSEGIGRGVGSQRLAEAQASREQLRLGWFAVWLFWAALYWVAFVGLLLPDDFTLRTMVEIVLTGCNTSAAAAMFVSYCVLTWEPRRPARGGRRSFGFAEATASALGGAVLYGMTHFLAVFGQFLNFARARGKFAACGPDCERLREATVTAFSGAFEFGSGIASAVIMAMLVGRLDSKYLDLDPWVLVVFYTYAAIQPSWSVLALIAPSGGVHPDIELTLFVIAWAAKAVLFVVWAWLFHTGRLDFYFLRISRLDERLSADWRALTAVDAEAQGEPSWDQAGAGPT